MFFQKQNNEEKAILAALYTSQAMIEFTPDGNIVFANGNFLDAVGYSLGEIQGKHHRMFCDSAYVDSSGYRAFWANLAAGEFQSGEVKRFGKGGKLLPYDRFVSFVLIVNPCTVLRAFVVALFV